MPFTVITADADESSDIKDPELLVRTLAERKGRAVLNMLGDEAEECLVIACDTLVYANGEFLGKPKDKSDAARMLRMLSGSDHIVVSGIYVAQGARSVSAAEVTHVFFDEMSEQDIKRYIDSGEPSDKAGAYAIQGKASAYIRKIAGDYFNVVGLPVNLLCRTLKSELGFDLTLVK